MIYFAGIVLLYGLHLLLKLNYISIGVLAIGYVIAVQFHMKYFKQAKEEEKRFYDASLYLDLMLSAFLREEKLDRSFDNVLNTLPEGKLKHLVEKAYEHMIVTFDNSQVMRDATRMIEEEYDCKRIKGMHDFMLHVESYGGDIEKPMKLLMADKKRWESRLEAVMLQRKKLVKQVVLSVIASLLICVMILYMPVMQIDISKNSLVQIVTILVLVLDDLILLRAQKYLSVNWLQLDLQNEDGLEEKMKEYHAYSKSRARRTSIILLFIGLIFTTIFAILGKKWLVLTMLFLSFIFSNQDKIGRKLQMKRIIKNVKSAFPNWLMDLVLLLQAENVQVALQKSRKHVPAIMKEELDTLLAHLEINPESVEPYHGFFKEFSIPQIHSAMNLLYSLSVGNSKNADRQIAELVDRNLELLDITEKERLSEKNNGLYLLFLAPVLTASFKLLLDMAIFLLSFLEVAI